MGECRFGDVVLKVEGLVEDHPEVADLCGYWKKRTIDAEREVLAGFVEGFWALMRIWS